MATFVDFVGLNTVISSSLDLDNNLISSGENREIVELKSRNDVAFPPLKPDPAYEYLVSTNLHRNGPYGYSTWRQLRVSENPLTRHHRETNKMTFVIQPGPVTNVLSNGELRVRSRYSSIYSFTEPAIAQKSYPLVWNVGRHFKDEDGNLAPDPQRFSIISSYGNSQIGFANKQADDLLKFKSNEEKTEYNTIKAMYLENGLNKQDSPLTHWEFIQYRETIFPHMKNQYISGVRGRPQFESFFRHNREDRTRLYETSSFGWIAPGYPLYWNLSQSTWPLDEEQEFLTREWTDLNYSILWASQTTSDPRNGGHLQRRGEGVLLSTLTQFCEDRFPDLNSSNPSNAIAAANNFDSRMSPGPLYMRRISLPSTQSVSNPSGMEIYATASSGTETLFQGGALWEAGAKRYVRDENGNYVHSPKYPFYDTYENYIEEARKYGKNYSVIPEFRMSTQIEDFKRSENAIELDMFEVTGGISGSENSSKEQFYEVYSNSDFMRNFELINKDHEEFTNGKVLSLRCKAIKKFLPYEGFYPAQRTVDLAKRFYDSYKNDIKLYNLSNVEIADFNYGNQMIMTPLFAPGVLFNTIKSGVAVDYPVITGSLSNTSSTNGEYLISKNFFDLRIPFEAIVSPKDYLKDYKFTSNEPHPSGNLSSSAVWGGDGDEFYSMMANNFTAEVPEFFLPNGQLTSIVSKRQEDLGSLIPGEVYGLRIKMKKSTLKDGEPSRYSVYHSGSEDFPYYPPQDIIKTGDNACRETFTMYSRPSAFGPPTLGYNYIEHDDPTVDRPFVFDEDREKVNIYSDEDVILKDSRYGYNFPFTPPYYHGEAWCDIWITASSETMTIKEIIAAVTASYSRFDHSFYTTEYTGSIVFGSSGPQGLKNINRNAVQLSASLNLFGIGKVDTRTGGSTAGSLIVDTGAEIDNRWVIQTKFETPMLNFNHVSGSDHITLPEYGSGSVPRGMWHQHGRIPEENEGVSIQIGPIPNNYQHVVMGKIPGSTAPADKILNDLSEHLGFSGISTKLGRIATSKTISEAVVAVPFIESEGRKKFFKLPLTEQQLGQYKRGEVEKLTTGDPQTQIGRSVLLQLDKMKKFIFPPSFDFLNFNDVDPIAMYVFEFSHTLSQQDLSDIWQNLPPDIGQEMEVSEVAITHPILKKELLGQGGESGNTLIDMPNNLKWMVFKVKQRAANNYFKKVVKKNPAVNARAESRNVTQDEFGPTTAIQYNWPYDFFSLVEMVKLDAEVEFGNFDEEAIRNYTDSIPEWNAKQADMDKIEQVVGGLEDNPIEDTPVPDDSELKLSTEVYAGSNLPRAVGAPKTISTQTSVAAGNINVETLAGQQMYDLDRQSAMLWMENLRIITADKVSNGQVGQGSKESARRMASEKTLTNNQANLFMTKLGFFDSSGNFINSRWEMILSSNYGGIPIPSDFSKLQ